MTRMTVTWHYVFEANGHKQFPSDCRRLQKKGEKKGSNLTGSEVIVVFACNKLRFQRFTAQVSAEICFSEKKIKITHKTIFPFSFLFFPPFFFILSLVLVRNGLLGGLVTQWHKIVHFMSWLPVQICHVYMRIITFWWLLSDLCYN